MQPTTSLMRPTSVMTMTLSHALRRSAVVATTVLLAGCGSQTADQASSDTSGSPEGAESSSAAEDSPSPTPESESSAPAAASPPSSGSSAEGRTVVPVYYAVSTQKAGPRLVREFTGVESEDPLLAAANLVTSGDPANDTYRTLWPGGEVTGVQDDESTITVALADNGLSRRPQGMTARQAHQAIQQMVYTLQGVAQARRPVTFTFEGEPAMVLGIDTSNGIRQDRALKALNLVSITTPEAGASLTGRQIRIEGVANSFEGNVVCRLIRDGEVLSEAPFTAESYMGDKLFPFEGRLPRKGAEPGPATVRCSTDDPTGGSEGSGIFNDERDVTLR